MNVGTALLVMAVVSGTWGIVDAILVAVALDKRGIPINMVLFRIFIFRYLSQYRQITLRETGRVGPLYYSFIVAMNVALVCVLVRWLIS